MNKARIILSALGVLAVIGSALAFKANRTYGGNLRCATTTTTAPLGATALAENCLAITYATNDGGPKRYCTFASDPKAICVVQRVVPNN